MDPVWAIPNLVVAIRVKMAARRTRKKSKKTLPEGWTQEADYSLAHNEVGGVTDGRFTIETRSKGTVQSTAPRRPPSVSGKLGEALDATNSGAPAPFPIKDAVNTSQGIVEWTKRNDMIQTVSVF